MNDEPQIENAMMCFACGKDNPIGLRITFTLDDTVAAARRSPSRRLREPRRHHLRGAGRRHERPLPAEEEGAYGTLQIRYRRPLEVGQTVKLSGWIESERRRLIVLKGEARLEDEGDLVADAEAVHARPGEPLEPARILRGALRPPIIGAPMSSSPVGGHRPVPRPGSSAASRR